MHFSICVFYLAIVFKSCLSEENVTLADQKNVIGENQTDYKIPIVKEERNYFVHNSSKDSCDPNPCINEENCTIVGGNVTCRCDEYHHGQFCEREFCYPNPCINGGACIISENEEMCICSDNFFGPYCEESACEPNPCLNNGECTALNHSRAEYNCSCRPGFSGKVCEYEDPDFTTGGTNQTGIFSTAKPDVPGPVWIIFYKVTRTTILFDFRVRDETQLYPITHYYMIYRNMDELESLYRTFQRRFTGEKYKLTSLIPGATYTFSVAALNAIGEGQYTEVNYTMPIVTVPEPPEIPTSQQYGFDSPNSIFFQWDEADDGGSNILEFQIRYYKVDRGSSGDWKQIGAVRNITVAGNYRGTRLYEMEPESHYMIRILARNAIGKSSEASVVLMTGSTSDIIVSIPPMFYITIAAALVFIAIVAVLIWVCVRAARKRS